MCQAVVKRCFSECFPAFTPLPEMGRFSRVDAIFTVKTIIGKRNRCQCPSFRLEPQNLKIVALVHHYWERFLLVCGVKLDDCETPAGRDQRQ
jgi:hypothetical protein